MKVKNIMFSGFMAAVLAGACGAADAATVLASKEFVTTELGKKQDTLTAGTGISIENNVVASTYSDEEIKADIQALEETVGATAELGGKTIVEYIDAKTEGVNSTEAVSQLQNKVSAVEGKLADLEEGKTVAEAIAGAVADKVTNDSLATTLEGYTTDGEYNTLAGRVGTNETNIATNSQAIAGLESSKADKSALDALTAADGKITVLETTVATHTTDIADLEMADTGLGNRLTALESGDNSVTKQIENATTALEGQINAKADASVVSGLSDDLDALEADAITKTNMATELAGYATDDELSAVSAVADAAQTAAEVKATVEGYGYQTADDVDTAISTAAITQSQVTGLTDALAGKVDDADLNNYYTKTDADAAFLEDAGLENGAAYLVTKDATTGKVVYQEVAVVASNGTDMMIGRAQ